MELHNVWVAHPLKHLQLVVDHLLVAAYVLLEDDFDCDLALGAVGLADNAIRAGTQRLPKAISGPRMVILNTQFPSAGSGLLTFYHSCRADRAAC